MRIAIPQLGMLAAMAVAFACGGPAAHAQTAVHYQNFNSAIYVPIDDMRRMAADPKFLQDSFDLIHASIKFNKVWLETYRTNQEIGEADVRKVKQFFESKGIQTSGGIMADLGGRETGCARSAGPIRRTVSASGGWWLSPPASSTSSSSTTCSCITAAATCVSVPGETGVGPNSAWLS